MDIKSAITKRVITQVITRVVDLLSSISKKVPSDQIIAAVEAKMTDYVPTIKRNNDIGMCVDLLLVDCQHDNIASIEKLNLAYDDMFNRNTLVVNTIAELSTTIAKNISPIIYELREVIPQESTKLAMGIEKFIPSLESIQNNIANYSVFDWGKMASNEVISASMIAAQDRTNCFKDGVARQHDPNNVLRRIPYGTPSVVSANNDFYKSVNDQILAVLPDSNISTFDIYNLLDILTTPSKFTRYFASIRELLTNTENLSANIVNAVRIIDNCETILRAMTVEMFNATDIGATLAPKLFDNIECALLNVSLLRASMIFHKVHTLQNKLVLSKDTVQASALETFKQAGGTEQMIKDHLLYMELTPLQKIPNNGLSLDVILNSSNRAKAVVQKHEATISAKAVLHRTGCMQESLVKVLETHYKTSLESGKYNKKLGAVHEALVQKSLASLNRRSIDDIALEYLITMKDNTLLTKFFKSINSEFSQLVKARADITPNLVSESICNGVISVVFDVIANKFAAPVKQAA